MSLDKFNQFLGNHCGVTKDVIDKTLDGKFAVASSLFFQPYCSKLDPLQRVASIVTAPVCSSILAIESLLFSVLSACKVFIDLLMLDPTKAMENIGNSAVFSVTTGITLFSALFSPIINAINLLFGAAATMSHVDSAEEPTPSLAPC